MPLRVEELSVFPSLILANLGGETLDIGLESSVSRRRDTVRQVFFRKSSTNDWKHSFKASSCLTSMTDMVSFNRVKISLYSLIQKRLTCSQPQLWRQSHTRVASLLPAHLQR